MKTVDEIMALVECYAIFHSAHDRLPNKGRLEALEGKRGDLRGAIEAAMNEREARQAPCARHCEAQAFKIEIRGLKHQLAGAWAGLFTKDQIADAACFAEIGDSKLESMFIALNESTKAKEQP